MKALLLFTGKKAVQLAENENTANMAKTMTELGFSVDTFSSGLDNMRDFLKDFSKFIDEYQTIVVIGGMGDEYKKNIKEVLAAGLGLELITHEPSIPKLERLCLEQNRIIQEEDLRFISVPKDAEVFEHPDSVIPGFCINSGGQAVAMLPDNGEIYIEMFTRQFLTHLLNYKNISCYLETYYVLGLREEQAKTVLGFALDNFYPAVTLYSEDGVAGTLQIAASDHLYSQNENQIERVKELIFLKSNWLVSQYKASELPRKVVLALKENGFTIAVAETLTGGLLARSLKEAPNGSLQVMASSNSLLNNVKHRETGIPLEILKAYPDASEEVCISTAASMVLKHKTSIAVSINGGMVADGEGGYNTSAYIGISTGKKVDTKRFDLFGLSLTKKQITSIYTIQALIYLYNFLSKLPNSIAKFDSLTEFDIERIITVSDRLRARFAEHEENIIRRETENRKFQHAQQEIHSLTKNTVELERENSFMSTLELERAEMLEQTTQNLEISLGSVEEEVRADDNISLRFAIPKSNNFPPSFRKD